MNHIRSILVAAIKLVSYVGRQGLAVIVHCSDGWDRTSQVTALSQLLLDPYYRTIKGFQILVEKEWLTVGYKFQSRTGHGKDFSKDLGTCCSHFHAISVGLLRRVFDRYRR